MNITNIWMALLLAVCLAVSGGEGMRVNAAVPDKLAADVEELSQDVEKEQMDKQSEGQKEEPQQEERQTEEPQEEQKSDGREEELQEEQQADRQEKEQQEEPQEEQESERQEEELQEEIQQTERHKEEQQTKQETESVESQAEAMKSGSERQTKASNYLSTGKCGTNLTYTLDQKGVMRITGSGSMYDYYYTGSYSAAPWWNYTIKTVVIGKDVANIGEDAFYNCSSLESVMLQQPSSLIEIGESAFYNCSGLKSITLPNSLTSIEAYAFYNCSGLKSITLPKNLTSIGAQAFYNCSGLSKITLQKKLTTIGRSTFANCSGLSSITLPNNLTSIGSGAFANCSGLTSVTMPGDLLAEGSRIFSGCQNVKKIYLSGTKVASGWFSKYNLQGDIEVQEGVTKIGSNAFANNVSLKSIKLPNSLESIGVNAFYNCNGLSSITLPKNLTSIGTQAFYNCSGLSRITLPQNLTNIEAWAFYNCNRLGSITLPQNLTSIKECTFYNCSGLSRITLPQNLTNIGEYAFYNCSGLSRITLPKNLTSIEAWAFANCSKLTNITIGNLSAPNRVGYTFEGWYTQAKGGEKVTAETSLTQLRNHGVYAHWKVNRYQVTFQGEGGSVSPVNTSVTYGNVYGVLPTPVREGYLFRGWYTAKTGGKRVTEKTKVVKANNHMLYARWKAQKYQVTFHENGGKISQKTKNVTYGAKYGKLPKPSRNNYYFLGWYTVKSGGKVVKNNTLVNTAHNHTLYAHWKKKLAAPKITVKVASYNSVKISWKKVSGANGYVIYRAASKNGKYKQYKMLNAKTTSYTDKKLKAGKSWYYKVAAYNKIEKKNAYGYLSKATGRTLRGKPRTPIQNIIKTNGKRQNLIFSWKSIKNAQKVVIFRKMDNGSYKPWRVISAKKTSYSCSYSGFARSHTYTFRLRTYYTADSVKIYSNYSNGYTINLI